MWNSHRFGGAASAAFEDIDLYPAVSAGFQPQAQGGGGGFPAGAFRPKQESQLGTALSRDLQAAQLAETGLLRPGQYGSAPATAQSLLAGPQGLFAPACADKQQALQQQAVAPERCGVGDPWRIDQDDPLALPAGVRQRRDQPPELTHSGLAGDQFGHGAPWPAAAGQLPVQAGVAGGQGALPAAGLPAFPQVRRGVE